MIEFDNYEQVSEASNYISWLLKELFPTDEHIDLLKLIKEWDKTNESTNEYPVMGAQQKQQILLDIANVTEDDLALWSASLMEIEAAFKSVYIYAYDKNIDRCVGSHTSNLYYVKLRKKMDTDDIETVLRGLTALQGGDTLCPFGLTGIDTVIGNDTYFLFQDEQAT